MSTLVKKLRAVVRRAASPGRDRMDDRLRQRRRNWEQRWGMDDYHPDYELGHADAAVQKAVEDAWFTAGMRVLDIGCGAGHNAAWMARQGMEAVGIDFASNAIQRARDAFRDVDGVSFEVVDVVADDYSERFDALLDRGCLHGIDEQMVPAYLVNLKSWAQPGAKFLLIMRDKGKGGDAVTARARRLLEPEFEFISAEPVQMAAEGAQQARPGVSMRFVRSSDSSTT